MCKISATFSASLKTSLSSLKEKFQIFKILPRNFDYIQKSGTEYGQVYKGSTLANQNQPDDTTDIVADANITLCPDFNLPKLSCYYSHVLSLDETETCESFTVPPDMSQPYEKLTRISLRGLEKAQKI